MGNLLPSLIRFAAKFTPQWPCTSPGNRTAFARCSRSFPLRDWGICVPCFPLPWMTSRPLGVSSRFVLVLIFVISTRLSPQTLPGPYGRGLGCGIAVDRVGLMHQS